MLKVTILLGGISIAFLPMDAAQAADSLKISCTGDMFEPGRIQKIAYYADGDIQSRK